MQKLSKTVTIYRDLDQKSHKLIHDMIEVMNYIDNNNEEIIKEISTVTNEEFNDDDIDEWIKNEPFKVIEDAKTITKEIDAFAKATTKGSETLEKNVKSYPYLASAYYGDMYDNIDGLDALKEIIKELDGKIKNANIDFIIDSATAHFNNLKLQKDKIKNTKNKNGSKK